MLFGMAASSAHRRPRLSTGIAVSFSLIAGALLTAGCQQMLAGMSAGEPSDPTARSASTSSPMANAAEIRNGACYEDFALATQSIDAKLSDSVQDIGASAQISDESLRQDIILGLRFNANLQKRVAFDTLEACLR